MSGRPMAWVAVLALAACSGNTEEEIDVQPSPVACTMIGCSNGVRVVVDGNVPERYSVQVRDGSRVLRSLECRAGTPCDFFVENEMPTDVTVRIVWGDDHDREWTVTPTYRDAQPNGPACPPTCRQGTVTITM